MFDHYIALDWAQSNMAISKASGEIRRITTFEAPACVKDLKIYLGQLRGTKILALEESTAAQWLYTELRESVDDLIICDPYRNRLLSEGAKNDKIDSIKLLKLLKADLLKPVFHSCDEVIQLRKLVSGYIDLVQAGVRLKNQRSAFFFAKGRRYEKNGSAPAETPFERFVLEGLEQRIGAYQEEKKKYAQKFSGLDQQFRSIHLLKDLPGISDISAATILARVVDPRRFPSVGHFLSYCGLIRLDRVSGGKSYGTKAPRYCRALKNVFKTAAASCLGSDKDNPMRDYYYYLIETKRYPDHIARHALARRIATLAFGILKSQKRYNPERRRECSSK